MAPLIPIAGVTLLSGIAWYRVKKRAFGKMTPERKKIFEQALKTIKDPVKLRTLAKGFKKAGLNAEAKELEKRAALFESPPALNAERTKAFKKAMSQTDPAKVLVIANGFYQVGAYEAANRLREYAKRLSPTVTSSPKAPVQKAS